MSTIDASMLPALLGRPVAYQPVFTRLPGVTVQGAIFLSQALFLTNTPTANRRQGWFYKDQEGSEDSWEAETGMSAKQQATARKPLRELGALEEVRKGMPAKCWYRVNLSRLAELLALALSEDDRVGEQPFAEENTPPAPAAGQFRPSGESRNSQVGNQDSPDGGLQIPRSVDFFTETTTENLSPPREPEREDIFAQAARRDDNGEALTVGARQFPMSLDWEPDAEYFAAACQRAGLPADTTIASHQLAKFAAHHADQPNRRHGAMAWTAKLVDWIRNDARQANTQPAAIGDISHANRHPASGQRQRFANVSAAEARRLAQQQGCDQTGGAPAGRVYDGEYAPRDRGYG